jgi:hypothetical protein
MRFLTPAVAALAFVTAMDVHTSSAQRSIAYSWCLDHGSNEGYFTTCAFNTLAQCVQTGRGDGGICYPNQALRPVAERSKPQPRRRRERVASTASQSRCRWLLIDALPRNPRFIDAEEPPRRQILVAQSGEQRHAGGDMTDNDLTATTKLECEVRDLVHRDFRPRRRSHDNDVHVDVITAQSLVAHVGSEAREEIERVIVQLETMRDTLRDEGDRIQREIVSYADLSRARIESLARIAQDLARCGLAKPEGVQDHIPHELR